MEFIKVASVDEIENGKSKIVDLKGEPIAIFNVDGNFYAIHNTCLHKGGPLGEGYLAGDVVICPWHGWQYDVKTGISTVSPTIKVKTYKVKVDEGKIFVGKID